MIIASIPNVQFFGVIHFLAEGKWTYQKEGILDEDHLRFFTFTEIEKLFHSAGLEISVVDETLDSQYEAIAKSGTTSLKCGRVTIDGLSPDEMRRFFVFQYKIVARQKVIPGATESDSRANRSDEMRKTRAFRSSLPTKRSSRKRPALKERAERRSRKARITWGRYF